MALIGFLFGAFVSYVALERIAQSQDMGPNKEIIQLVVGIVAGMYHGFICHNITAAAHDHKLPPIRLNGPIATHHTPHTGILGVGIGLCAANLAVLAAGALFGLALTMGLLSIPR